MKPCSMPTFREQEGKHPEKLKYVSLAEFQLRHCGSDQFTDLVTDQ